MIYIIFSSTFGHKNTTKWAGKIENNKLLNAGWIQDEKGWRKNNAVWTGKSYTNINIENGKLLFLSRELFSSSDIISDGFEVLFKTNDLNQLKKWILQDQL